jgi:hypothetical protein
MTANPTPVRFDTNRKISNLSIDVIKTIEKV